MFSLKIKRELQREEIQTGEIFVNTGYFRRGIMKNFHFTNISATSELFNATSAFLL